MKLDVFPDQIHPPEEWPPKCDPLPQDFKIPWSELERVSFLKSDMDHAVQHARALSQKLRAKDIDVANRFEQRVQRHLLNAYREYAAMFHELRENADTQRK